MKRLLIPVLICGIIHASAQENSGTITYEEVYTLNIELDGEMAQFAAMLPKEKKTKKQLQYTKNASLYTTVKAESNEHSMSTNGMNVVIKTDEPEEVTFKDLAEGKMYQQKEFMGRQFMITGEVKGLNWKLTDQQKEVQGYPCQQAVSINDEDTITAWYTPAIPVASGPNSLGGLPGMILEVAMNSDLHITAIDVKQSVDESALKKPKGGKKVTSEQYQKIVEEKTKEMQAEYGGSGNRVIKMMVTEDR